jgi:hypothetical protein
VVAEHLVQEAIRLKLIQPADADRYRDPVVPPPDRPFDGVEWTKERRHRYAIASAASGVVAELPPRPPAPPSGRPGMERLPRPKKRRKGSR